MSKRDSKSRILYIYQILLQETDSEHKITIQQIIDKLSELGITAYRKTIISDIDELRNFGADIVSVRSSQNLYYLNSGLFSLTELKLLVDAVCCSHFITSAKSTELIKKLGNMTSIYNKDKLGCHIYLSQRLKSDNEEIYSVVDTVNDAVNQNQQISFQYFEYDAQKNKILKNDGIKYKLSPYGMTWDDGNYYVIGYSVKHEKVITFRADRMLNVEIMNVICVPKPDDFNIAEFVNRNFHMYSSDEVVKVTLKCKNELMKSVIDRFGLDVETIPLKDGSFKAIIEVAPSRTFFAWVFQFNGEIKIISPAKVRKTFIEMVKKYY